MVEGLFQAYDMVFSGLLTFQGLDIGAKLTVAFMALLISIVISLIHKFTTDQEEMKQLKQEVKQMKEKMEEAKKNDDTEKMNQFMNKSMEANMSMLKQQMKPMLITMVAVLLILPYLHATFDQNVMLSQDNGSYSGTLNYQSLNTPITYMPDNDTAIVNGTMVSVGEYVSVDDTEWQVRGFSNQTTKFLFVQEEQPNISMSLVFFQLPFSLPLIGSSLEWLGFYIILTIPISIIVRKLMGVH